ncbi:MULTISPECIES: DUF6482 family protein [unclassified Shewanella]|uniref:DUF6482 family protein n=1 Tax=unclassified Shewanella TaxID=196818 RepID=UPI000C823031|nr:MULTISPECIES: DUF6482 family protein [unclassified Shewanella]MDO6641916.1 DUF6482 family protein [Shewanella sp. 5_MG-2023]MDO6680377.1 DUF6482 family protein [Shewanella sp. 4_MG-2023]MDO6777391.1 DUF6482 family protein [Shewanella sp. 3_MG-2023]
MPSINKAVNNPRDTSQHGLNTFEQSVYNDSQPTIIGVADSTHYLVGVVDADNNFSGLTAGSACTVVNSLAEAKTLLRSHYYSRANVVYQTAYDEMCGLAANGHYHESIKL